MGGGGGGHDGAGGSRDVNFVDWLCSLLELDGVVLPALAQVCWLETLFLVSMVGGVTF